MAPRRVRFRPPGVKPWTRIGPLGPFRGRLGLAWVIAPLVAGAVLVAFAWALLRPSPPGGTFRRVGPAASFGEGSARPIGFEGVYVGRRDGQLFAVRADSACSLTACEGRYVDCRGVVYELDGRTEGGFGLDLLPLVVYDGTVYVDPAHPVTRRRAPEPQAGADEGC